MNNNAKILVVENGTSVHDLEFAVQMLKYYGFDVREFPSGSNAWHEVYKKK